MSKNAPPNWKRFAFLAGLIAFLGCSSYGIAYFIASQNAVSEGQSAMNTAQKHQAAAHEKMFSLEQNHATKESVTNHEKHGLNDATSTDYTDPIEKQFYASGLQLMREQSWEKAHVQFLASIRRLIAASQQGRGGTKIFHDIALRYKSIAECLHQRGNDVSALKHIDEGIKCDPTNPDLFIERARIRTTLHQTQADRDDQAHARTLQGKSFSDAI